MRAIRRASTAVLVAVIVVAAGLGAIKLYRGLTEVFDPTEVRRMSDGRPVRLGRQCQLVDAKTGLELGHDDVFTSYEEIRWTTLCAEYQRERQDRPRLMPREKS